jgi:hypothetical protein
MSVCACVKINFSSQPHETLWNSLREALKYVWTHAVRKGWPWREAYVATTKYTVKFDINLTILMINLLQSSLR